MKKKTGRSLNIAVFGSRSFDGCKTILRLFVHYSLIGILILSTGCNPSSTTVNYNQTAQPDGDMSQRETILMGGGGGGTGDGGGGQGVYCSDAVSDKNLKGKLLVRDIYEAIKNHNRSMPSSKLGGSGTAEVDDTAINHLVGVLKNYFGPAYVNLDYVNAEYWKKFAKNISFIAEDATIHPSQDANSPLALPKGCAMVQIAYWDESSGPIEDGTLWVDKARWMQLNQFNKIALLAHEFFFKQARKAGFKNSDFVRHKVGQLLSDTGLPAIFQNWTASPDPRVQHVLPQKMNGYKICEGVSTSDPSAKLQMYQYEGSDGNQHIVFPVLRSANINSSDLQIPHVTFSADKEKRISLISDVMVPATHYKNDISDLFLFTHGDEPSDLKMNLRYTNSGQLLRSSNFKNSLHENRVKLKGADYSDIIWTLPSQNNSKPVNIILHNPFGKPKIFPNIPKSREDLIVSVNNDLKKEITRVNWYSDSDEKERLAVQSVLVLNNEIDEMIRKGRFDTSFPEWSRELKTMNMLISTMVPKAGGTLDSVPSKFDEDKKLSSTLPKALFILKTGVYTEKELEELGIYPYQTTKSTEEVLWDFVKIGSISFQQAEEKVTFNLKCKDYIDTFKEFTQNESYKNKYMEISRNNDLKIYTDQKSYSSNFKRQSLKLANHLADFLTSELKINKRDLAYYCFDSAVERTFCSDIDNFFADMQTETRIEMSYCEGYQFITNPKNSIDLNACTIINMIKSNQKYLMYFSYRSFDATTGDDEKDSIDAERSPKISYLIRIP